MNYVKVLGSSGNKTRYNGTTSFQIYSDVLIDAGNVISPLGEKTAEINHIFITHSHSDHINDLPFIIESFFEYRKEPLTIYASKETIKTLKQHTFNDKIWPDFTKINILNTDRKSLVFKEIKENETINLGALSITSFSANHIAGAYGFMVIKDFTTGYLISGDTYKNPNLWKLLNKHKEIKSVIIECSFPSSMEKLAQESKHYTPKVLREEIDKYLKRDDIQFFIYHIKSIYYKKIKKEIYELNILSSGGKILEQGDVIHIDTNKIESDIISQNKFKKIMKINLELSSELNKDRLFEMIVSLTRELTHCEAGSLYILSKDKKYLDFKVIQNSELNINKGGTKETLTWDSLPLYLNNGEENKKMVAVVSALENRIINIEDVYYDKTYDFEGTKKFDSNTGYRSKSMLVIPLTNHENDVIGVLQLINKTKISKTIVPFNLEDEEILKSLGSQAAMALTNSFLINNLEEFLNAFVETIAQAIDAKSEHTSKHITKVAKIASYIAEAINKDETIYKDIKYDENDFRQIELAALMHDVGKISMPETVIDKSTKLETMLDRIELVKERIEIVKRDKEIEYLKKQISKEEYDESISQLNKDLRFLKKANIGGEFMHDKDIERVKKLSKLEYLKDGIVTSLLNEDEVKNLSIRKGTLSEEEKEIMNNHAQLTLDMLSNLPFPKKYSKVLDIASNHHEKLNGKGYPRGLSEKDLSLEDRIMILSDIFEALTASDRPYKKGKKLSEVFKILSFMAKENEIDMELLKFFFENNALVRYISEELKPSQIDESKLHI